MIKNPFPDPATVSVDIDNEVRQYIDSQIKNKNLKFLNIMSKIENETDLKRKEIYSYYCTNIVINTPNITDINEKNNIISGLFRHVYNVEY